MSTRTAPLAALSTVFTPPCTTSWLLTTTKVPSQFPAFPTTGPASCDPPFWTAYLQGKGFQYYSPAVCPDGFEIGVSCGITKTRTSEGFPPVTSGESAAYCVPSGHTCTTDTTDFRGGVWGFTKAAATGASSAVTVVVGPAIQIRGPVLSLPAPGNVIATSILSTSSIVSTTPTSSIVSTIPTTSSGTTTSSVNTVPDFTPTFPLVETGTATSQATSIIQATSSTSFKTVSRDATATSVQEANSSSASNSSGMTNQAIRSTSLAAVVLSSVLLVCLVTIASFTLIQRGRLIRSGQEARPGPFAGFINWVLRRRGSPGTRATTAPRHLEAAELSAEVRTPELGTVSALGTAENPAELDDTGAVASSRWSWMSRISSMLWNMRIPRITRSSSLAEASSKRLSTDSSDWEEFAKSKWQTGLTVPRTSTRKPLPELPRTPRSVRLNQDGRMHRNSSGTFGPPLESPALENPNAKGSGSRKLYNSQDT